MTAEKDKDQSNLSFSDGKNSPARKRLVTVVDDKLDSRDLFSGARELTIAHGSDVYRLRLTSQNKLILTK
ncbi:MAG: hemin uptake protein HemP [Rhizobiales bacterium]|nr:hemin uptake protein HemP [Hyphomicrobiales bacterium]OJY46989.1 MAG: hemin transporter HemP [Rhizobiales bacterium 64-17]